MHVQHRDLAARIAHPDSGCEAGRVADEPRVRVLVRRAGLARGGPVERRPRPGAEADVVLEDAGHDRCDTVGNDTRPVTFPGPARVELSARQQDLPDRGRLGVDAARGEGCIGGGHVERRDRDRAEAHRGHVLATHGERRPHAQPAGHRGDSGRAHVERQLRVHGVVGAERRLRDRGPARVARVVRLHAPPRLVLAAAGLVGPVGERRRHVVRGVRVHAPRHRRSEDERLEGRAGLPPRLREQVELIVRAARDDRGHRADRAGVRIDRDDRRGGVLAAVQRPRDRLVRQTLQSRLDRRVDAQTARANCLRAVCPDELVAHETEEVRLTDLLVEIPGLKARRAAPARARILLRRDHLLPEHREQHLVPPGDRAGRIDERVVGRRRLRQPREQRRLGECETARRAGVVRACRRLGTVCEVAVEDRVEVRGEDSLLRPLAVELHGQARLGDLPLDGALARDVEGADELLRDRRAALDDAACVQVAPERAGDPLGVDPAMRVEAAIFDRHRRERQPARHPRERDDLAVPLGGDRAEA